MRRNVLPALREDDQQRLIPDLPSTSSLFQDSYGRIPSYTSLEPHEDPVSGLERVSSHQQIRQRERARRVRLEQDTQLRNRPPPVTDYALSGNYESLDYEIVENEIYRAQEATKDFHNNLYKKSINRWIVCFFIGIFTAIVGAIIDILVFYSSKVKYHLLINGLVDICEHGGIGNGGCMWIVLSAWTAYNCLLVAIAAWLVLYVSAASAGSGIPLIKSFLNGVHIPGVVTFKTLVSKSLGRCMLGCGWFSKGPMIHSGAAVAALVSQGKIGNKRLRLCESFQNDREKRDFVSAGAAAGVSAAFAAPIRRRSVFTAMVSTFTLNLFLSFFYGRPGFLSWNGLANFGVFENGAYNVWEIPFFALIGALGGILGALFNALNARLAKFRKRYIKNKFQKFFEAILVAAASAFCGFLTLFLIDDCVAIGVNPRLTDVTKLWCERGKYSAVANLFFQNPEESVKSLLHSPFNAFRPITLLVFSVETFILTMWTYGLSVPGGLFIPLLMCGAAWGRLVGLGVDSLFPTIVNWHRSRQVYLRVFSKNTNFRSLLLELPHNLVAWLGMTISLTAIIMEATKDISFVMPIMITLWAAKFVGDYFNEGIYDINIEQMEIPILGWNPPKMARNILASDIMRKDVIALEPKERVGRLLDIVKNTRHHAFPVVDRIEPGLTEAQFPNYGRLKGLILRSQILTLLKKKHFTRDYEGKEPVDGSSNLTMIDFTESYTQPELSIADLHLSVEEERCWVDFRAFYHQSPHRVPKTSSLGAIFRLFRGLGLRHVFVVNDDNRVRGIITRKDIARFKQHRVRNRYLVREVYISE
ncbi:hypothetical protein M3Y97_00199300 [Aphelenchoides bicaudatus]|nr:hypothetical protein M3Y97_00199300 [Aphelenchoides bicaudatus]